MGRRRWVLARLNQPEADFRDVHLLNVLRLHSHVTVCLQTFQSPKGLPDRTLAHP